MSNLTIARMWSEDDGIQVTVDIDHEYPQALDEARSVAIRLFAETLEITLASETKDDT